MQIVAQIPKKTTKYFTHQGLKRHKPSCHDGNKYLECHNCGEMVSNANALKKHKEKEHTVEAQRSKEICYHCTGGGGTAAKAIGASFVMQGFRIKEP